MGLTCKICFESASGQGTQARITSCGHVFCQGCATIWFRTEAACPVCRSAVAGLSALIALFDHDAGLQSTSLGFDDEASKSGGEVLACEDAQVRDSPRGAKASGVGSSGASENGAEPSSTGRSSADGAPAASADRGRVADCLQRRNCDNEDVQRHEGRIRDRDQGITRNIDHFMEELRREQEAIDKRTAEYERRRNELRSQLQNNGAMSLDDREGAEEKDEEDWEEEYVVLDLDDVFHGAPVPNFAYTLSGLDTLNPILTLDNGLKLIGQYMETVGSVVVYSEKEKDVSESQAGTREPPTPADPYVVNTVKKPLKRIRGVCKLERKLKFCAMPIETAPAHNGMFMQSVSVHNAMPAGNTPLMNAMPVGNASHVNVSSLHKTEDASLENTLPSVNGPKENARATEDASLEKARETEDTAPGTLTAREDASVENTTATEGASFENAMATEGLSLENTTATEGVSLENATATEVASSEITRPTEDPSLGNATPTEDPSK